MAPQMKGGWCSVITWNKRLTNAMTRPMLVSDLIALNSKLRYIACLDESVNRGSSID